MEAVIFHRAGKRLNDIQKGLQYENIKVESRIFDPNKDLDDQVRNANLVIFYIKSPDFQMLDKINLLRSGRYMRPIVVLDEVENEASKQYSLNAGADAYFPKPLGYCTLAMRLKILICKKEIINGNKWLRVYDLRLDLNNRFVKRGKHLILLRNKEFALLEFFIINRGKVLSRNTILEHVWDRNANFASNTVDVHINRLRRKIDDPFNEKLIHTVYCIGYLFDKKNKPS